MTIANLSIDDIISQWAEQQILKEANTVIELMMKHQNPVVLDAFLLAILIH